MLLRAAGLLTLLVVSVRIVDSARLPAKLAPPVLSATSASSIHVPPPAAEEPVLSPFEALLLACFRWQTQQQTGCRSNEPGFAGMLEELREYQRQHTVAEQADASGRIMAALAGRIFHRPMRPACKVEVLQPLVFGVEGHRHRPVGFISAGV